jgi:hypothetical protein
MAGIILGKTPNSRGKRVWLPPGATRELQRDVILTCRVPVKLAAGEPEVCGAKFYKGQEALAEQHSVTCCQRHADVIRAVGEQWYPAEMNAMDAERFEWMRRNKAAILQGRMRV